MDTKTVGFGYRTSGIATPPIVQDPTLVRGLNGWTPFQIIRLKF